MKCAIYIILRNIQIFFPAVNLDKPEALWMTDKRPDELLVCMLCLDKLPLLGQ